MVGVACEHAGTGADHAPEPLRLLEKDLERLTHEPGAAMKENQKKKKFNVRRKGSVVYVSTLPQRLRVVPQDTELRRRDPRR